MLSSWKDEFRRFNEFKKYQHIRCKCDQKITKSKKIYFKHTLPNLIKLISFSEFDLFIFKVPYLFKTKVKQKKLDALKHTFGIVNIDEKIDPLIINLNIDAIDILDVFYIKRNSKILGYVKFGKKI